MPDKHLPFGGSTADRTLNCPAWRQKADKLPPQGSSSFADEGTMLHDCMELIWTDESGVDINSILSDKAATKKTQCGDAVLTPELWEDKLIPANEAIDTLMSGYNVEQWYCEPFVELIEDEAGGSIDMIAFGTNPTSGKRLGLIIDYKFGYNQVAVENNSQLLFYALCSCVDPLFEDKFAECDEILTAIVQPNGQGDVLDSHIYDIDVLDEFELNMYDAIDAARGDNPQPNAGSWCKYCPAAAMCEAKTGEAAKALRLDPKDAATLGDAMAMVKDIEDWVREVKKQTHEQLEIGVDIPGWKLVDKRATRKWSDEELVTGLFKKSRKLKQSDFLQTKLISPTQFEKLAKKAGVDFEKYVDYIASVSSGTTVAPADDPRSSALPSEALKQLSDRLN